VGGQKLDLAKLYHEVTKRNGHKEVTVTKQWKQVADAFNLTKSLTSSSFLMRTHYERFLYEFEAKYRTRHLSSLLSAVPPPCTTRHCPSPPNEGRRSVAVLSCVGLHCTQEFRQAEAHWASEV
jgi:hypothetical protein